MKRLINIRKKYKSLSRGEIRFLYSDNNKILAFTRTYESEVFLVIVNLSRFSQSVELDLHEFYGHQIKEVFSKNTFSPVSKDRPYHFTIGEHDCQWYELRQQEVLQFNNKKMKLPDVADFKDILLPSVSEMLLSDSLPEYMQGTRWFGGKARPVQSFQIAEAFTFNYSGQSALFTIIKVNYKSGHEDYYQLALGFAELNDAVTSNNPEAVIGYISVAGKEGVLFDLFYDVSYQHFLMKNLIANKNVSSDEGDAAILFTGSKYLRQGYPASEKIISKMLNADQSNTSIIYNNLFFLKIYRKVDRVINQDLEIMKFLHDETKFRGMPSLAGSIALESGSGKIVLGMLQELVPNSTDGWSFFMDRLHSFNDRLLSDPALAGKFSEKRISLSDPIQYTELDSDLKELLEGIVNERIEDLGRQTAEMHIALSAPTKNPDFTGENFSLHYQRSLYSSFQGLLNKTFLNLEKSLHKLEENFRQEAEELLKMKEVILDKLKLIYRKKFDLNKIRIHGDFHLGQVLFAGKDLFIIDFEGEPSRSYSERRLKRAALKDVAGMIRSFHYVAYASLYQNANIRQEDIPGLAPLVERWFEYISNFYLASYLANIKSRNFIPEDKKDIEILLGIYLLEKAIYELDYELNNRPAWVIIPIRGIKSVMNFNTDLL